MALYFIINLAQGYRRIGNAVPIKLAEAIAKKIMSDLKASSNKAVKNLPNIKAN